MPIIKIVSALFISKSYGTCFGCVCVSVSVSVSICYHLAATFLNNFLYYTPLDSCTYYGQGARDAATLSPALPGNPLYVRKYGRGSNWHSQCSLSVCMHVQTMRICKIWSAFRSRSCLLKIQVDSISAVPGDISLSPYMLLVCMQYGCGLHYVHARKPSLKSWLRPLGAYVLVITPLGGMLLVYRPETEHMKNIMFCY